jgi:hypothetical protein
MPFVHGVFFVCLDQFTMIIINFLPKTNRVVVSIDLFEIARSPAQTSGNFKPITSTAPIQFIPIAEFLFILSARAHDELFCQPKSNLEQRVGAFFAVDGDLRHRARPGMSELALEFGVAEKDV